MKPSFSVVAVVAATLAGAVLAAAPPAAVPTAATPRRPHLVQSVELRVPAAPTPVSISGKAHVAYELHIGNPRPFDVVVERIDVLDADRGASLASLHGSELAARLGRPGLIAGGGDRQVIGAGLSAVVYFWLALDGAGPPPRALRHRLELTLKRAGAEESTTVEGAPVEVRSEQPIVLSPPLRGGPWVALYDPTLIGGHRTAIYTLDGQARIPGRFAIDWVRLADDGSHARGDATNVADWLGYGAEVLAVADAVVAAAMDDLGEDLDLSDTPRPVALEDASGNFVSLDLGGGRYAFYEHLRPGSIRVAAGDRVERGAVLGLLGNSGSSSTGPHLHFHVADAPSEHGSEGLPFELTGFAVVGTFDSIDAAMSGRPWLRPVSGGGERTAELPAPNVVVAFPPRPAAR